MTLLDRRGLGHLKNVAVPLEGALLVVLFMPVVWGTSGNAAKLVGRLVRGGINAIGPIVLWSVLGVLRGALRRLSDWIAAAVGLGGPA